MPLQWYWRIQFTLNVSPVFSFEHEKTEAQAHKLRDKYFESRDIDAVEIVFGEWDAASNELEEEYETYVYLRQE